MSKRSLLWRVILLRAFVPCVLVIESTAAAEDAEALRRRIADLEAQLAAARAELAARGAAPAPASPSPVVAPAPASASRFKVGGAIRVNWTLGDYETGAAGPSRGGHGGDFSLDTFRINPSFEDGPLFVRAEYRWYSGVNFPHTIEAGWRTGDETVFRAGLTRVPFGVGPYGPANSWFFDQHYYLGLADDMDLGAVHTVNHRGWTIDWGAFVNGGPNGRGSSPVGARYSFDFVDARRDPNYAGNRTPTRYVERGQLNLRAVRAFDALALPTAVGISGQYGRLPERGGRPTARSHALALHSKTTSGPWTLMLQATRYDYDSAFDHITGGFYDYTTDIAARGRVLSAALSHTWTAPVTWVDSITFYNDYSRIQKSAAGFRDSTLNVLGAAIARGGWYIYTDWACSDGNEFVGNFRPGMWADNARRTWQSRFNVNFGYYY